MIAAAALCPAPPLLVRELTGQAEILPDLRHACTVAVARLVACAPDVIAVVGPADLTATWDAAGQLDLAAYAPALAGSVLASPDLARRVLASRVLASSVLARSDLASSALASTAPASPAPASTVTPTATPAAGSRARAAAAADKRPVLPLTLGLGARLLDKAGYDGPRALWSVAGSAGPAECARLGLDLAAPSERVALLVMGDGSARRSVSAPGYLDERAEPFDTEIERAVREGDMLALAALDPVLAHDLMVSGRPAWQVLAAAIGGTGLGANANGAPRAEILYSEAPFGVAYLVAALSM